MYCVLLLILNKIASMHTTFREDTTIYSSGVNLDLSNQKEDLALLKSIRAILLFL